MAPSHSAPITPLAVPVRAATVADLGGVAATLTSAFTNDPPMVWLFGDEIRRRRLHLGRYMRSECARHVRHGSVIVTADSYPGVAVWDPPGQWRPTWLDLVRAAPAVAPGIGARRLPRALRGLPMLDRAHPAEPHWYLALLGTTPACRGRGVATALLEPMLRRCDITGVGAYLESSRAETVPFYERFGFEISGDVIRLPGGPPMWPMWRSPAGQAAGPDATCPTGHRPASGSA